jgi:hypothetical protein
VSSEMRSHTLSMPRVRQLPFSPLLDNANTFTGKTVTSLDVVYALKRQGRTLYGFGG